MSRGMNRAMIIGFVEREPEMRHTSSGQPVASFSVSTKRHWTTNAGEAREATEWFSILAWGDLAEAATRHLKKDQRIYVEGYLQTRSWEDADGQRHVRTEVVAGSLIPMDDREAIASRNLDAESELVPLCLNRVIVIGNLGRDPEMRYTPEGQAVTFFSLATTYARTSGNDGRRESTEWFNIVSWGGLAEICNQYLTKGRRVYVEGELRTRGWEQPDGKRHFRTELVANEMIMLGPRPRNRFVEHDSEGLEVEPPF
ncbi:MAG TPA: single-stranded DNA-binding protein [Anaerolineae bacterium]|nr:single-stranded DNA-binding protein [Anaerolineae bacterium]